MYSIDLSKFAALVSSRPALCAKLVNPSPVCIAEALKNHKSMGYLKPEWFTVDALIAFIPHAEYYYQDITKVIKAFKPDVRKQLPLKDLNTLVKHKSEVITYFPQASLTTWKIAVSADRSTHWLNFEAIPEAYRVPELLIPLSTKIEIPKTYWTPELAWSAIRNSSDSIEYIPVEFITSDHLKAVFQNGFQLKREDLPESLWSPDLAELAIQASENNLDIMPPKYRTKTLCLIAVKKSYYQITYVPDEILDTEIMLEVLAKSDCVPIKDRFKTLDFMLEIARHDTGVLMTHYRGAYIQPTYGVVESPVEITEPMWCALLEVRPIYLKFIPKSEQTKAMIDSALKSATASDLNLIANTINLNLITKENAMLFMGTSNTVLNSCIEKKLGQGKKPKHENVTVALGNQVFLDLTASEYRKL